MEDSINKLLKILRIEICLAAFVVLVVAILGAFDVIPNGALVGEDHERIAYIIKIIAVLFTIIGAWVVIRLFELNTEKTIHRYTLENALRTYHIWYFIKVVIMTIATAFSLVAYFLTIDNLGLLCAAIIVLLALIYCIPSKDKIKQYLEKAKENSEKS